MFGSSLVWCSQIFLASLVLIAFSEKTGCQCLRSSCILSTGSMAKEQSVRCIAATFKRLLNGTRSLTQLFKLLIRFPLGFDLCFLD